MDKKISTLLAEIKDATGWSEVKIAEEIGTSQPTVNRILNGQDDCKGSTLRAISELHRASCAGAAAFSVTAPRRATDPAIQPGHGGRQPVSPHQILDTLPERAVITPIAPGDKA
jgi:transcriptional regulator with XRE-family HTH domain